MMLQVCEVMGYLADDPSMAEAVVGQRRIQQNYIELPLFIVDS